MICLITVVTYILPWDKVVTRTMPSPHYVSLQEACRQYPDHHIKLYIYNTDIILYYEE